MRDGEYDVLASVRSWKSGEVMNGSSSSIGEEDGKMKVHHIVYTVEVEVSFHDDEMKSEEDLRGFFNYVSNPNSIDNWVAESVHGGDFSVVGIRFESKERS